jgi:hypothetical protein
VYAIAKKKRIQVLIGLLLTVVLVVTAVILPSERNPGKMYPPDENAAWAKLEGMTEVPDLLANGTYKPSLARDYIGANFPNDGDERKTALADPTSRELYVALVGGFPKENRHFNNWDDKNSKMYDNSTMEGYYQTVRTVAASIMASNTSEQDIALACARWVADYLEYGQNSASWYGAIESSVKTGTCEAYTELFNLLANECGLPAFQLFSADHTWSGLYVAGQWRYADIQLFDDPITNGKYRDEARVTNPPYITYERVYYPCTFDDIFATEPDTSNLGLRLWNREYNRKGIGREALTYAPLKLVPDGTISRGYPDISIYGRVSRPVIIEPVSLAEASVGELKAVAYTGASIKPLPKITMFGRRLTNDTDYTLTYGVNKKIGKGKVTIKGKGDYKGSITIRFDIVPTTNKIAKLKKAQKAIKVKWSAVPKALKITRYQISYRLQGKTKWKTKSFKPKTTSATIKKLKANKRYEVRVRSYKTLGGIRYCAAWSKVKTIRTR